MMTNTFSTNDITFSLEIFPPKSKEGLDRLFETVDAFSGFNPSYLSVTLGAGGVEESVTLTRDVVRQMMDRTHLPVAAHVTSAGHSRAEVDAIIDSFWHDNVRHIVALRGDILGQASYVPREDGYAYSYDFVAGIKCRYPSMKVSVAGYPETHPDSPSEAFDLDHLKKKVDAGADAVLTQFFFDPDVFLRWRDRVSVMGIKADLIPGLLPIVNFQKLIPFAQKCNATVPRFLHTMFAGVEAESTDHKLLAMNVLSHQITRLIENGVKSFHFYTLNDTLLTRQICVWLRAGF